MFDFQFDINRYLHPSTKQLLTKKEAQAQGFDIQFLDCEGFTLYVEGNGRYTPACLHKLPEDCYPEDLESDIISIQDIDGNNWMDKVSSSELNEISAKLDDLIYNDASSYRDDDYYEDIAYSRRNRYSYDY